MATDGPVLADLWSSLIARGRSPVFSVTSELAASVSFQAAPPKPARNDPAQSNDSFGALVDSNTAAADTASAPAQQQPQPAAPRRADDAAPGADNTPSRDTTSGNQTAQNAPNGSNASTSQPDDANAA